MRRLLFCLALAAALLAPATVSAADTTPPVVSIVAPTDGQTVARGSRIWVTFTATDDSGLVWVDLTANGQPLCSVLVEPYTTSVSCSFDVPHKPRVAYAITATGHDGCTGADGSYSCPPTWDGTNSATATVTVTSS